MREIDLHNAVSISDIKSIAGIDLAYWQEGKMENNTVTILNEEFENDKTGEKVQGITVIVDGKLKEVIDLLMEKNPNYKDYTEIVRDAFFNGINQMISESK